MYKLKPRNPYKNVEQFASAGGKYAELAVTLRRPWANARARALCIVYTSSTHVHLHTIHSYVYTIYRAVGRSIWRRIGINFDFGNNYNINHDIEGEKAIIQEGIHEQVALYFAV